MARHLRTLVPLVVAMIVGFTVVSPASAAPSGTLLWASRYGGADLDQARSITTSPDGARVFVTGSSVLPRTPDQEIDAVTVAYDAIDGNELWVSRFHPNVAARAGGFKVIAAPDGTVVYVGIGWGPNPASYDTSHVVVIAYDSASGQARWTTDRLGSASSMALSPDGRSLILGGVSSSGATTQSISTTTGQSEWLTSNGDPATRVISLCVVPNQDLIVETYLVLKSTSGYAAVAVGLDRQGHEVWSTPIASSSVGVASFVAASADGSSVVVAAGDDTAGTKLDFLTTALDPATGTVRWSTRYSGPRSLDQVYGLVINPQGSKVFVTGSANRDYTTLAYRIKNGHTLWMASYDGGGLVDRPWAIGLSRAGTRLFISGDSPVSGDDGVFATVAYVAGSGQQLWAARYDQAPGHVGASDLAVGPLNNHVFVTGSGSGAGKTYDYVTLAYAP